MAQDNNYFSAMERKYNGDKNFINNVKPEHIQRSAKERIFREMIRGQINYVKYGHNYLNPRFLENIIISCEDELNNSSCILNALTLYDNMYPGNGLTIFNKAAMTNKVYVYRILYDRLVSVKWTGDIGYLTDIEYVLNNYQNVL